MYFDTFSDFIAMGGYAAYVWSFIWHYSFLYVSALLEERFSRQGIIKRYSTKN